MIFYVYKNQLEADRNYMQSDASINGWMFVNHLGGANYEFFETMPGQQLY